VKFNHVALEVTRKEEARIFFEEILGIPKVRSFVIPPDLSEAIFGEPREIEVENFAKGEVNFEVFFSKKTHTSLCVHVCVEVEDREKVISKCRIYGITPNIVKKGDRELLFIKDFSGNLFEIKKKG
jgi:catechol 2,3-dioxygenase-like lactoylglutathione lyase family enzyme